MEEEQNRAAKGQMVALMQAGQAFQEASRMVGVQMSRSAAYRLLQIVRTESAKRTCEMAGMDTLPNCANPCSNGSKDHYQAAPGTASHLVQQALESRFGVLVSISHLNAMHAALGLGSRATPLREKNHRRTQASNHSG
jgi:hypothetical protein